MSWDLMVFNFGGKTPPPMEQFEESAMLPLEKPRERISSLLDGVDWSDPAWGIYRGDGYKIGFNIGNDELITNIMLHVRGGGDAIAAIIHFAKPLGWSVLDCSTGDYLDLENPSQSGWEGFQAFRDKVMRLPSDQGEA